MYLITRLSMLKRLSLHCILYYFVLWGSDVVSSVSTLQERVLICSTVHAPIDKMDLFVKVDQNTISNVVADEDLHCRITK